MRDRVVSVCLCAGYNRVQPQKKGGPLFKEHFLHEYLQRKGTVHDEKGKRESDSFGPGWRV